MVQLYVSKCRDCRLSWLQVVEGEVNACKGIVQALGKDSDKMKGSEDAKDIANRQVSCSGMRHTSTCFHIHNSQQTCSRSVYVTNMTVAIPLKA